MINLNHDRSDTTTPGGLGVFAITVSIALVSLSLAVPATAAHADGASTIDAPDAPNPQPHASSADGSCVEIHDPPNPAVEVDPENCKPNAEVHRPGIAF